jgi:hypothetical protein
MIFVAGKKGGVFYHRLQVPYEDLLMRGYLVQFGDLSEIEKYRGVMTHLVINRGLDSKNYRAFRSMLNSFGIKLIVDIDDWWSLPYSHPNKSVAKTNAIIQTIRIADEIHTTHAALAERIQKENPYVPIWILPNAIDERRSQWLDIEKVNEDAIGYVGALYHDEDLSYNEIDISHLNSYSSPFYKQAIQAQNELPILDYENYGKLYKNINVSIAPLRPSQFNHHKSNLKALEAGFTKTCIIAQRMHPYTPFLNDNNAILCGGPAEWKHVLRNLDFDHCKSLAEQLHKDVQFFTIENINNTRQQCFAQ